MLHAIRRWAIFSSSGIWGFAIIVGVKNRLGMSASVLYIKSEVLDRAVGNVLFRHKGGDVICLEEWPVEPVGVFA
jgi:hypothetical protein